VVQWSVALQRVQSLSIQVEEEEARLTRLQEEADTAQEAAAAAQKHALSAQNSLLVLEEKHREANSGLQKLKTQLVEVLLSVFAGHPAPVIQNSSNRCA
jgi:hypothetical protein